MYCGKEKPTHAAEFLADFVKEACMLLKDGLTVDQKTMKVTIHSFLCDSPARAFGYVVTVHVKNVQYMVSMMEKLFFHQ